MTHFYLTLPSNSSTEFFPENTLTKFTTRLQSAIELDGAWEVGLSELIFPRSWTVLDAKDISFTVTCDDCSTYRMGDEDNMEGLRQELTFQDTLYDSLDHLIRVINQSIEQELTFRYRSPEEIQRIQRIEEEESLPRAQRRRLPENIDLPISKPNFEYNNNKICINLPKGMGIEMSENLAKTFGFGRNQMELINNENQSIKVYGEMEYDVNAGINSLYVYCDILEHVPVGDTKAPLLRIVNARGSSREVVHLAYHKPRYLPLQKKHFDSIEIDIRDCFGDPIPFVNGQVVAILEFNRTRNPYFL